MEYFLNLPTAEFRDPAGWAARAEGQGWNGICASDHFWVGGSYPHVFVTATQLACATERIRLTTSFCNNLFRSPVEFAQAALTLQQVSNGRFEAGLGAGWAADEMHASGMAYPDGPTRVSMYVEALQIVSSLLQTGQCEFSGNFYRVSVTGERVLGPRLDAPPPLVASAGGPRAVREVAPLVDRIEIKAIARATQAGALDFATMATVTRAEIERNIERVRRVAGELPIGIFVLVGAGESKEVASMAAMFEGSYMGGFFGHPEQVARTVRDLEGIGIGRVQLTELVPGTHDRLAPYLLDTG